MNLFLETRKLTQQREDHLTCFLAAALAVDPLFRNAYETCVLIPLANGNVTPRIKNVDIQVDYKDGHCRPDMLIVLQDGRQVACEHKIDADETILNLNDEKILYQIERYLELPGIDAVAYFRTSLKPLDEALLRHPRYLRPDKAHHFLWRDLYKPLCAGNHLLTTWLRSAFEELGFTPPVENIGILWPDQDDSVKKNQNNFGKLWDLTRIHLATRYKVNSGRRCELYLEPRETGIIRRAYVSPLAQGGNILRLRLIPDDNMQQMIQDRLSNILQGLPVTPLLESGTLRDGNEYIDLMVSLRLIFNGKTEFEKILFDQIAPVLDAMVEG